MTVINPCNKSKSCGLKEPPDELLVACSVYLYRLEGSTADRPFEESP